jgi:restriction endonuclease S subunit
MNKTLQDIATIHTGMYSKFGQSGSAVYLQVNFFNEHGDLEKHIKPNLVLDKKSAHHLLQDGDVLFAAKGAKNFAAVYETHNGPCVASSTFLVIRIKPEVKHEIQPKFLAWYINHPNTQQWLKSKAIGSSLPSISKGALMEMEIMIPSIEKQNSIEKLNGLKKLETSIQKQLLDLREQYIQQILLTSLK